MIIYKTINLINGKIYIGQDTKNNPDYYGSGIKIKNSINKYGVENFKKVILCKCESREELDKMEEYWIKKSNATDPIVGYNISTGGNRFRSLSGSTNEKISNTLRGRKQPKEVVEKRAKSLRGKKKPKSFCEAMSKIHKGKTVSEETKQLLSTASKNLHLDPEYREKYLLNRPDFSGNRNPFFGRKHSDESKEKMRQAKLKKKV